MKTFFHCGIALWKRSSFITDARRLRSIRVLFSGLAALGIICVVGKPVRADSINNPLYDVNGTMTVIGNNVCTSGLCTETINFSFELSYNFTSGTYIGYVVPGTVDVSSYGALGSTIAFDGSTINGTGACGHASNYMPFRDSGTEVDLNLCGNYTTTPVVPSFNTAYLWSCGTATCVNDFVPPAQGNQTFGILLPVSVQANVVAVPEGGTSLGYLAISLVLIGLAIRHAKLDRARASRRPSEVA